MTAPFRAPEFPRSDVEFIRAGFSDACTRFVVTFHRSDFDVLKKAIRNVGDYNGFDARKVVPAIAKIEKLVRHIGFGREGSPVMFIYPSDSKDVATIIDSFKNAVPNECSVSRRTIISNTFDATGFSETIIRLWWD
jgi:hypothetical protein